MVREMLPASPVVADDPVSAPAKGASYYGRLRQQPVSASDEIAAYLFASVASRSVAHWENEKDRFPCSVGTGKTYVCHSVDEHSFLTFV